MDPRLLGYYNDELHHLREMGKEFAGRHPKIASRLGLIGTGEAHDPYVEQLLQGFAFLAARVQLKIDSQFPRFSQHLLESVYPDYLSPTPSACIVQLQPDLTQGDLREGPDIPRNTRLLTELGKGDRTACEYRTAHDVRLWPVQLSEAEYLPTAAAVFALGVPEQPKVKAGIRLRLRTTIADLSFADLALDKLVLFLAGSDATPVRIYEQLLAHGLGLTILPTQRPLRWQHSLTKDWIRQTGFSDNEALLPYTSRSFQGYRLLREYFMLPQRFRFIELNNLSSALQRCEAISEIDLVIPLSVNNSRLANTLQRDNFALFCTPAINLFEKKLDRIQIKGRMAEQHAVLDRTRSMDFEVYRLTEVLGHGTGNQPPQNFLPFYAIHDIDKPGNHGAYYTVHRRPRVWSQRQRRTGLRSGDGYDDLGYIGSEIFVALVDMNETPYSSDLQQLSFSALCTNRDLPLLWRKSIGQGQTDFTLELSAPVEAVRCLVAPSAPRPAEADGQIAWLLISQLSLNYLSLLDGGPDQGAIALRELLELYSDRQDISLQQQINGVKSVYAEHITRRIPRIKRRPHEPADPIAFGRGLRIVVTMDDSAFEGTGAFLLGAVLERFFAKYVSINAFTQTIIRTENRELMTWPVQMGLRHTL